MNERLRFIEQCKDGEESMTELCEQFGISRQTGYKWLRRCEASGPAGLADRSRAPHHHPNEVWEDREDQIIRVRLAHRRWGPRKILAFLQQQVDSGGWPAASTIGELLKNHNLVRERKRRRHAQPSPRPFAASEVPNAVWCADYKGHFRTGDGCRCDPLTITDARSRFLLRCQAVRRPDYQQTRAWFELTFREYGLPAVIHTDNGTPFASTGIAGLSRLSVWWIRLGILPDRSRPAQPQDNGRHERMHLTLKQETADPPERTLRRQQGAFDSFQQEYNYQRPHEALGNLPPATVYQDSARQFPSRLPELEYDVGIDVCRVYVHGQIYWRGREIFLGEALSEQMVGLEMMDDRIWRIRLGPIVLGWLDRRTGKVMSKLPRDSAVAAAAPLATTPPLGIAPPTPLRGDPQMPRRRPVIPPAALGLHG